MKTSHKYLLSIDPSTPPHPHRGLFLGMGDIQARNALALCVYLVMVRGSPLLCETHLAPMENP